jgi:hypothetical protein
MLRKAQIFVFDMAKRRRNGPPPGIPILMPVPNAPQAVSGPSMTYPLNTVFIQMNSFLIHKTRHRRTKKKKK